LQTLQNVLDAARAAATATTAATQHTGGAEAPLPRSPAAPPALTAEARPLASVIEQALAVHRRRQETAHAAQQAMAARNAFD